MARSSDSNFLYSLLRDKSFQAREIRRVIKLSLIYLALTTILVAVFYNHMIGRLLDGMAPLLFVSEDIALTNDSLPAMGTVLGQWMVAMLCINLVITTTLAVYITRKLGHPILAIKRALREIGNGNLDVRLRSTDNTEFSEIAAELTNAMDAVRQHINAAKQSIDSVPEIQKKQEEHNDERKANDVDVALNNCRSALDFFQVEISQHELMFVDDNDAKAA